MSRTKSSVSPVGAVGPLAPFAGDLRALLEGAGYRPTTIAQNMRAVARLDGLMKERQVGAAELTSDRLEQYRAVARSAGRGLGCSERVVGWLRDLSGGASTEPAAPTPLAALLAAFRGHLVQERGLLPDTADAYVARAGRFLAWSAPTGEVSGLLAGDVTRAVLRESEHVSARSAQYFVTALRSFLRFGFVTGRIPGEVSAAALGVSCRPRSSLPLGISASQADALLASCDRGGPPGQRDFAVIMVLLRLGLRSAEVAGLALDDIDWRAGQVLVRGKGDRQERLPLPADVGEAIVAYLRRDRPMTAGRAVFLRQRAPIGPVGRGGVSAIVRRASVRAGMTGIGAHRLRHTLACEMVTAGVPLAEIGQVLRHRSQISTANYARVDLAALRALAQPWPGADGDA